MASKDRTNTLSLSEKIEVIGLFERKVSVKDICEKFRCGKTQIYNAVKRKDELRREWWQGGSDRKRKRKSENKDINNLVWEWYVEARTRNQSVTGPMLQSQAKAIADQLGKPEFKASNGWLTSFKNRHNISSKQLGDENMFPDFIRKKFLESGVESPSWQFYSLAEPAYRNTSQGEPSTSGADRNCDDEDDYEDRPMPCEVIITENESSNVTGLDVSDMDSRSLSRSHRSRSHSESSEVGGLVMNCESEDIATDPSGERPPSNNSNHTAPYRKKQKIPREDILEELLEEVRESNRIAKQHDRQVIALLKEEVELHKQELESQKRFFALLEAHYISK